MFTRMMIRNTKEGKYLRLAAAVMLGLIVLAIMAVAAGIGGNL